MNKIAVISLSVLGGSALFAVSFLGFAKLNGVALNTLPVVGGMFPPEPENPEHAPESAHVDGALTATPPTAEEHGKEPATTPPTKSGGAEVATSTPVFDPAHPAADAKGLVQPDLSKPAKPTTIPRAREAHAGIFGMLDADSLYTQAELRALADSLRARNREVEQHAQELDRREDLLADRLTALDERRRTLDEFAKQLDARERELKAGEAEAKRDAQTGAKPADEKLPAGDLSGFFGEGETEVLVKRLAGFTADETAQILIKLSPARAKELLDALPNARWRECAEAYSRAAQPPPP